MAVDVLVTGVVAVGVVVLDVAGADFEFSATVRAENAVLPAGHAVAVLGRISGTVERLAQCGGVAVAIALGFWLAAPCATQVLVVPADLAESVLDRGLVPAAMTEQLHLGLVHLGVEGVLGSLACTAEPVEPVRVGQNREGAAAAILAERREVFLVVRDELPDVVVQLAVLQRGAAEALQEPRKADAGLLQADTIEELETEQERETHG